MTRVDGLTNLRTFGWSLSGAVDVDANEYNGMWTLLWKLCGGGGGGGGGKQVNNSLGIYL